MFFYPTNNVRLSMHSIRCYATASSLSKSHNTLSAFLEQAAIRQVDRNSTVYRGTLFEYTVANVLKKHNFNLARIGGANDRGIDLKGTTM